MTMTTNTTSRDFVDVSRNIPTATSAADMLVTFYTPEMWSAMLPALFRSEVYGLQIIRALEENYQGMVCYEEHANEMVNAAYKGGFVTFENNATVYVPRGQYEVYAQYNAERLTRFGTYKRVK